MRTGRRSVLLLQVSIRVLQEMYRAELVPCLRAGHFTQRQLAVLQLCTENHVAFAGPALGVGQLHREAEEVSKIQKFPVFIILWTLTKTFETSIGHRHMLLGQRYHYNFKSGHLVYYLKLSNIQIR